MNVFTYTPQQISELFGWPGARQLADELVRSGRARKEIITNNGKPNGCVYTFYGVALERTADAFRYISGNSIDPMKYPDKTAFRLLDGASDDSLTLYTPWGPRYDYKQRSTKIKEGDKELATLGEIREVSERLGQKLGYQPKNVVMYADAYGRINGLPEDVIIEYGEELKNAAYAVVGQPTSFVLWSGLAREDLRTKIEKNIFDYITWGQLQELQKISSAFGSGPKGAMAYAVERIVEGQIIEELYNPIKLSAVKPQKDNLDGPLPRVYVIRTRAPWMG